MLELLYKTQHCGEWLKVQPTARRWLTQRFQLPADVLNGRIFQPRGNTLSVFRVEPERKNAARILAALGSKQHEIVNTDCLFFDERLVTTLGIRVEETPGRTPDKRANSWHFDLAELTATHLKILAEELINRAEMVLYLTDDLITALREADGAGDLDRREVQPKVLKQAGI